MSASRTGRVLRTHPAAPWLPAGGRADVVLAGPGAAVPASTCLVRLLATRGSSLLAVARQDGDGLDVPTRTVGRRVPDRCVQDLLTEVLGGPRPVTLLGYVRNVVPDAPPDYPWPSPDAYFAVWHCRVSSDVEAQGRWLDQAEARLRLAHRHWWPLGAHALG